jgi:hypothetical protein
MDRVVSSVTVSADRSTQYEGRARRLTLSRSAAADFRSLVRDQPAAATPSRQGSTPSSSQTASPASTQTSVPAQPAGGTFSGANASASQPAAIAVPASEPNPVPTAESVFGESPWMTNPSGQGPLGVYYYNPVYFATAQTAEKVAQLLGGTVVQQNAICSASGSPFQQLQPNYMVQMPNGRITNPGLVAAYYTRGYPQSFIDRLLDIERTESA